MKLIRLILTIIGALTIFIIANGDVKAEEIYDGEELYVRFFDPVPMMPLAEDPDRPGNIIGPMFFNQSIVPGDSFKRQVSVRNKTSDLKELGIEASEFEKIGELSDVLIVSVTGGSNNFDGTLTQLYNDGEFIVDTLEGGQEKTYEITVTFYKNAGNKYMGKSTSFNVVIGLGLNGPPEEGNGQILGLSEINKDKIGDILGINTISFYCCLCLLLILILIIMLLIRKIVQRNKKRDGNLKTIT